MQLRWKNTVLTMLGMALLVPFMHAQSNPAPRINPQQKSLPNSALLRGEPHATAMQRLRVVRQYNAGDLRTPGRVQLGSARLNFAPLINNPRAPFNVAQRLRGLPQHVEVKADQTEVSEVEQGLVIHQVLGYRILPGKCNDASARAQLQSAGIGCFQSAPMNMRLQAFATPGDPHYVADPGKRQRAAAAYQDKARQEEAEISGHIADLRKQLAAPATRAQFVSKLGAAEVDRISRLSDDQLKGELINSAERRIEQTLYIPKSDAVSRAPVVRGMKIVADPQELARQKQAIALAGVINGAQSATGANQRAGVNSAIQNAKIAVDTVSDKDIGTYIFLTGFTLGKDYEWSQGVSTTINWCWIGCSATYNVDLYAGFSYGFGLRFPIQSHLDYKYTLHPDGTDKATVKVDFVPINGTPAQYAAAGLASDQIFEGKELVAQVMADAGLNYNLPVVGGGNIGISIGKDFTQGLPAPFTNGQFTPPAPGTNNTVAPIIFDTFDMLGGEGNFGVVGGQVFPAIQVGLHSDKLEFTFIDRVNGHKTQLNNTGTLIPVGIDNESSRNSHFTLANPVYNVGFVVTPGIDARLFVDLGVWGDHWDWPIWFPELTIELPPGGVDFGCHAGTVCSRNFDEQGKPKFGGH